MIFSIYNVDMDLHELGAFLRTKRKESGLKLGSVANKAKISRSYLYAIESGRNPSTNKASRPSETVLDRIATALSLDTDELFELAGYQPKAYLLSPMEKVGDDIISGNIEKDSSIKNSRAVQAISKLLNSDDFTPSQKDRIDRGIASLVKLLSQDFVSKG